MQQYSVYMQFTMRKKIFRLQANEKSFAAERFHRVDKNGDECPGKGGTAGGKVHFSSIWRPENVVIRVSFCHDNPADADGFPWGCGRLGMPDVRMKAGPGTG